MQEKISNYLKSGNINPLILENPASDIISEINHFLTNEGHRLGSVPLPDSEVDFLLNSTVKVDEKGNVKFMKPARHENIGQPNEEVSRSNTSYDISEDSELIVSKSIKSSNRQQNQFGEYYCSFSMTQHIYDSYGIEQEQTNNEFWWHKDNFSEAESLAKTDFFPSQSDFDAHLREQPACITIKRVTRNYDLGSAHVQLSGNGYTRGSSSVGCNVQLYGEHFNSLSLDTDANAAILGFYSSHFNDFEFSSQDFTRYRENNPSLNFVINKMTPEEKDHYYDWVNSEISNVYNEITRKRLQQLASERGLVSSKEKQANAMIEAMVNGTMSIDGETMINQNSDSIGYSRTMGFSGMWLLGLITGIMSCAMIILGVILT